MNRAKKIGIVGGIGWPSTMDYYAGICRRGEQRHLVKNLSGMPTTPEISIESLDLAKAVSYLGTDSNEDSWARFDSYHRDALKRLEWSGADFAIIASNTPHHRFDSIVSGIKIPVLSIVDVTAKECSRIGARHVLLLGTSLTMKSPVFRKSFAKHGVEATGPQNQMARSRTAELIADLQRGKTNGAVERLSRIAKSSFKDFHQQPAVCLACTELPLAFQKMRSLASFQFGGILYINANICHINAAFDFAVADDGSFGESKRCQIPG